MKLIDVTNSYSTLVTKQLENTDSLLVRVYSLGKTNIIYSEAKTHKEILINNKLRKIKDQEIIFVLDKLIPDHQELAQLDTIKSDHLVEITLPTIINEKTS